MKLVPIAIVVALLAVLLARWLPAVWAKAAEPQESGPTFEQRYPNLPKDALDRRARSMARLSGEKVPLNQWLPVIESEAELDLPSTEAVAMRAAATLVVALKGDGLPQGQVDALVAEYRLKPWLSPEEARFIADPAPDQRAKDFATWRYEAANVLLWALGRVDRLDGPRRPRNPAELAPMIRESSRGQFLARARLRTKSEILDEADLIYRYRWALVDAQINGRAAPTGLDHDVAMERHQALNWLIYHDEQDWDDVTLDT